MKAVSSAELTRLTGEQADAMNDICHIVRITRSSGTYSTQGTETRSMASGIACGVSFTNGRTVQNGQVLLIDYDAILRLPASQPVFVTDEILLTEKGSTMVSGTFQAFSQPVVNSSVQHVLLKRVAP